MKPCSTNRQQIAWMAIDALDERSARDLRGHIETCEGCRRYLAEISGVTRSLSTVEKPQNIQTNEFFHQRVTNALRVGPPKPSWNSITSYLRTHNWIWRGALPASALAALAIALSLFWRPAIPPVPLLHALTRTPPIKVDLPPTIANYTMVANQSLEMLDDLLTRQACKNPAPARACTVSNLTD
jgi:hypothetical protein